MRRGILPILLLASFGAPDPARAGVTIVMQQTGAPPSKLEVEGNRLRMEDREQVVIFDGEAKKLFTLDPDHRTYAEVDEASAREIGREARAEIARRRAEMEEALSRLPPEQRKQIEAMLGRGESRKETLEIVPLGKTRTVAGFSCTEYRIVVDGETDEEGCFIPWGKNTLERHELVVFERFGDFVAEMAGFDVGAAGRMAQYPGLPAVTRHVAGEGEEEAAEEVLKSLTRSPVPPERFRVPDGWRREGPPVAE